MRCAKCGKEAVSGDLFCAYCGNPLPRAPEKRTPAPSAAGTKKENKSWLVVLVLIATFYGFIGWYNTEKAPAPEYAEPTEVRQIVSTAYFPRITPEIVEQKVAELGQTDGLDAVPVFWEDGKTRRMVDRYPLQNPETVEIWDYLEDETLIRHATVYYTPQGDLNYKSVTTYDEYGNPTDVLEIMNDGSVWLHYYYENSYDILGRPLVLCMFNRAHQTYQIERYTYYSDRTHTVDFSEFRGALYEYDFETDPEGQTKLFYRVLTKYDAHGNVVSEEVLYSQ